jgi:N-acetylmuramoyl-L-alanine amidase
MNTLIILDPAHGIDTLGKCSPDKKHREYKWSRERCDELVFKFKDSGYDVRKLINSEYEIGLTNRVKLYNSVAKEHKDRCGGNTCVISLHNNAAGNNGSWMNARGVEIFTTPGITRSDRLADIMMKQLMKDFPQHKFRTDISDGDLDKEAAFAVIMGTNYQAMLIEWLFQDNLEQSIILQDKIANNNFVDSVKLGIIDIIKYYEQH